MKFLKNRANIDIKKGFTLVELLVSISIFLVVMTISLGAVISVVDSNRKSKSIKTVMTNLNSALEIISRDIKFGKNYHCDVTIGTITSPRDCISGANSISFFSNNLIQTNYRLNNSSIEKSTDAGLTYQSITAPDITIQDLDFFVIGSPPAASPDNNFVQPRVLISIRGFSGNQLSTQSSFFVQSTVSQRGLDYTTVTAPPPPPPPPPPPISNFRFVRWEITKKRSGASDGCASGLGSCIQASEFVVLQGGSPVSWPVGTVATNPGGSSPGAENPSKTIDGSLSTKWLDFNFASGDSQNGSSVLVIDTGSGNSVAFDGYKWGTANDQTVRDPISWNVSGSDNGSSWTLLDSRSDEAITTSRNTYTSDYNF